MDNDQPRSKAGVVLKHLNERLPYLKRSGKALRQVIGVASFKRDRRLTCKGNYDHTSDYVACLFCRAVSNNLSIGLCLPDSRADQTVNASSVESRPLCRM